MQEKNNAFDENTVKKAMRLAQSDSGKALLAMLQSSHGKELQDAMAKAAAGDMEQAAKAVRKLATSKEAKELMEKMQESRHG